jgi:hypothetical protein
VVSGMSFHPFCTRRNEIYKHRLLVEASLNGLEYETWVQICRTGSFIGTEQFLDPDCEIHHRDNDPTNNDLDNLEVMINGSHHSLVHHNTLPIPLRVVSIEFVGVRETYDIEKSFVWD